MAINAYCGVMGSGKSYEVVSGPLLDAVAIGRRVVTNIDGIDEDRIHAYLHEKRGIDPDKLGRVVHVTTERVREEGFFPVEVESSKGGATVTPGLVEPGDMVVVDEAWKLWSVGQKISKDHEAFFRMHRHFVNRGTGLACDVIVMVQAIGDIHRTLKPVFELSFVMVKLKALGAPTRYRVEMYEGWKQNKKTRVGTFVKQYKKEIFPLYKSYAGGAGKEAVVDSRQNILMNRTLWVYAGVLVFVVLLGLWGSWRFFHQKPKVSGGEAELSAAGAVVPASAALPGSGVSAVPAPGAAKVSVVSESWRVVGRMDASGVQYVVLTDNAGHLRVDSPASYNGFGAATVGRIDGQRVAMWSGGSRAVGSSILSGGSSK